MRLAAIPLALFLTLAAGCGTTVQNPVTGRAERTVMDERSELEQGRQQHAQVLAEYGVVKDEGVQAYVRRIGQRLAEHSERSQLEWHFTVLDSPEVNAFALPGGYVYVTRGIMAYMDSEADLAGVMGHEIGHVTARHGAQRATRAQTAGIGVLAASVLGAILEGRGVSGAGQLASGLSQNVAAGYIAHYGRDQESQADQLGAEYLSRAGYDPHNMVDVVEVLRNQERFEADLARAQGRSPQQGSNWLASHPTNEQRLRDIAQITAQYKGSHGSDNRQAYLQMLSGLAFGESREQGVTRGRDFFHEPLGFALTAPAGWKIQNQADALALVNAEGNAGLLMQMAPDKAGNSPEEIVRKLVQQAETRRYSVHGMPAVHFAGTRADEQGRAQAVEGTVVSGPSGRHYLFLYSAANAAGLQRARPQLQEAEASFRPLNDADRSEARPWTLRTVPYPRGGFAELAHRSPLPNAEQQLRLLNGFYAGGEPSPGQWVKTVE